MTKHKVDVVMLPDPSQIVGTRALAQHLQVGSAPLRDFAHRALVLSFETHVQEALTDPRAHKLVLRPRLPSGAGADQGDAPVIGDSVCRRRQVAQARHVDVGGAPAIGQQKSAGRGQQHDRIGAAGAFERGR